MLSNSIQNKLAHVRLFSVFRKLYITKAVFLSLSVTIYNFLDNKNKLRYPNCQLLRLMIFNADM